MRPRSIARATSTASSWATSPAATSPGRPSSPGSPRRSAGGSRPGGGGRSGSARPPTIARPAPPSIASRAPRPETGPVGPAGGQTLADLIPMAAKGGAGTRRSWRRGRAGPSRSGTTPRPPASVSATRTAQTPLHQLPETMAGGIGLHRLRRRRLARRLRRAGGAVPAGPRRARDGGRSPLPQQGRRHLRGRHRTLGDRLVPRGYGHGVAVGDIDNDGHPDLFLTRWRSYALYRNKGDGTFEDATERLGLGGERDWPTSAAFADLDGDGDLDLYVCHYLAWDAEHPTLCPRTTAPRRRPGRTYNHCVPRAFPPGRSPLPQRRRPLRRRERGGGDHGGGSRRPGARASSPPTSTATARSTSSSPTT